MIGAAGSKKAMIKNNPKYNQSSNNMRSPYPFLAINGNIFPLW
jgi:hypothetical protein